MKQQKGNLNDRIGTVIAVVILLLASGNVFSRQTPSSSWDTAALRNACNLAGASLDLKPRTADSLARLIYARAKQTGNTDYTGKGASLLAISEIKLGGRSGINWYDTAVQYLLRSNNRKWIAYTNLQIGYSLGQQFEFQPATRYLLKASEDYALLKDNAMLITVYTAISNMFHEFGDFASEKKYAKMAVALVEETHDTNADRRWGAYALLGISYDDTNEYDKALATHLQNIGNATNDWVYFLSYNNVGVTLRRKGEYAKAQDYFLKALLYAEKIKDDNSYATVYDNLARVHLSQHNHAKAKEYFNLAIAFAQKNNVPQKLLEVYETGSLLGKATGNIQSALDFFTKRTAIKDSLLNAERSRAVYNLQIKYESEEKEKENQRLQYENALKTVENEKASAEKRRLVIGSAAALLLLSVLFLLLYRNRIIKNKLEEEQLFTRAIMEGEQNERIRIARDLHDSIGQMLSVAKMNVSTLHYQFPENKTAGAASDLLDNALVELRTISHNLMPEDLNFGLYPAIENICDKINASGQTTLTLQVAEAIRQYPFEKNGMLTIYRIIQEILNNMVKHSNATTIQISMELADANTISMIIKDNGKGFDTGEMVHSRGLGWKNIAARVRMLDGKMQVRSEPYTGTQIDITIPIA